MVNLDKIARSVVSVVILAILWKFNYFEKIAAKISKIIEYLKKKGLIPNILYSNISKLSSIENVTIVTMLNNLSLNILLFLVYEATRPLSRSIFGDHQGIATKHAEWIWDIEQALGMDYEPYIQSLFDYNMGPHKSISTNDGHKFLDENNGMINVTWQQHAFGTIYWKGHSIITGLIYYFMFFLGSRSQNRYQLFMTLFWVGSMTAVFIYTIFPCAPPRYLPDAHIDDMLKGVWARGVCHIDDDAWGNCFAAMPSVHSLWCTICSFTAIHHFYLLFKNRNNVANFIFTDDCSNNNNNNNNNNSNSLYSQIGRHEQDKDKHNTVSSQNTFYNYGVVGVNVVGIFGMAFFTMYFILMHVAIFATGNHWILDAVCSWCIIFVTYILWHWDLLPYLKNWKVYKNNTNVNKNTNNHNNSVSIDIGNI